MGRGGKGRADGVLLLRIFVPEEAELPRTAAGGCKLSGAVTNRAARRRVDRRGSRLGVVSYFGLLVSVLQ